MSIKAYQYASDAINMKDADMILSRLMEQENYIGGRTIFLFDRSAIQAFFLRNDEDPVHNLPDGVRAVEIPQSLFTVLNIKKISPALKSCVDGPAEQELRKSVTDAPEEDEDAPILCWRCGRETTTGNPYHVGRARTCPSCGPKPFPYCPTQDEADEAARVLYDHFHGAKGGES